MVVAQNGGEEDFDVSSLSRADKKHYKLLRSMGYTATRDFETAEFKRGETTYVVQNPIVFDVSRNPNKAMDAQESLNKNANAFCNYVILGQFNARNVSPQYVEMMRMMQQQMAANAAKSKQAAAQGTAAPGAATTSAGAYNNVPKLETISDPVPNPENDADVDVEGLDLGDIELAIQQTGKSKREVVAALREHNKDVIDTIMHLTS